MRHLFLLAIVIIIMVGCKKEPRKIAEDSKETTELKKDTSAIEIADLPILIDSTDYLIHPIGEYKVFNKRIGSYSTDSFGLSDRSEGGTFSISSYNGDYISGNLSNLSFQHVDSMEIVPFTNKIISIKSIRFIHNPKNEMNRDIMIYEIFDQDTNKDQKLDYNDVKTLYISKIDGSNFIKLTPVLQELVNWKLMEANNTIYLRSIEDTNHNGEFDKKDKMHYFYVNLNQQVLKAAEYFPIE